MPKWLPPEDTAVQEFVKNCKKLHVLTEDLESSLAYLLYDDSDKWECLPELTETLDRTCKIFVKVSGDHRAAIVSNFKCNHWRKVMNNKRLSLTYLLSQTVTVGLGKFLESPSHLSHIFKLIIFHDSILPLGSGAESKSVSIVRNTCPVMMLPMRKLSLTKILQIVAQLRAEDCGLQLVYILMDIKAKSEKAEDECCASDNSSMEVYRALTENISPTHTNDVSPKGDNGKGDSKNTELSMLESLIVMECTRLRVLFSTAVKVAPDYLGQSIVTDNGSKGKFKMSSRTKQKIVNYYQEVLWGMVGSFAEYSLIWRAIGFYGDTCNVWISWLRKFNCDVDIPHNLKPALQSLMDGLTVHVTTVTWDHSFRKAIVAAGLQNSPYIIDDVANGTRTGLLFKDVFEELVELSNNCEGSNWTVAALEELPLTEQIPVLHRLDHSVHTCRLWAAGKARQLANMWNMDQFFRVTQVDISWCLSAVSKRHLAKNDDLLCPENSVHVMVCGKMRAKLVSEVHDNVDKLQLVPNESIDVLSSVCRIYSLANLQLMFPEAKYWKQQYDEVPQYASNYVEDYLDMVLKPVINAATELESAVQQRVCCLVLDIMCEAWLDHIYKFKIKFSEWGALQLLADFGAVPTWLMERVKATPNLLCTEMLRRCEGVGRLLLSQRGHRVPMVDKTIRKYQGENNEGSPQRMPPEMYVPNQTQWLELRATKVSMFSLCCPLNLDAV
ncbi:coiled-coil domain containing 142 [Nesidiocoris tenuis]|uniref:Coiled-coil domain containing 142 n=1 Tax=Nesidiocoris tenuis TaxID=355587 RepID=A0ABN7BJ05_9HEMI|nr:coiled-coil domain containing 142 [Nesidiocoris tenuis]